MYKKNKKVMRQFKKIFTKQTLNIGFNFKINQYFRLKQKES